VDDEALIIAIAAKNSDAMDEFHRRWFPQIARLATKLTGDSHAGEDIAQDTTVRVITKATSYQPGRGVRAWLMTIVYHAVTDWHRRRGVRKAQPLNTGGSDDDGPQAIDVAAREPTPDEIALAHERQTAVQGALQLLPEADREVILYRDYMGLNAPETGRILGIPTQTVGGRLFRARQRLAALLQTHWPELFPPGPT
jgi:RNA polymerase sigma-70 factor (ECF subfamily)